ncbi:helix-turn-helix domain-containing protein [Bacillus sp. SCS-151]|uniref:helix-turn-helix domain-containing protein n=1 Tax=Nanhaiella sioensis TaxID=3115293 RepID=UPI00397A4958
MGTKNWTTLCVIASFMNEKGECYPKQSSIANGLGVSRQTANKYIQKLLDYRWEGRPVVIAKKGRAKGGTFDNTRYTVLPVSRLEISNHVNND